MSDSKNRKKSFPDSSAIFTIDLEQSPTSSDVPDVSDLLGKSKRAVKQNAAPTKDKTEQIDSSPVRFSIKSLKEFDTMIEIHFELKENSYHYLQHNILSNQDFFGLDEMFQGMKIPESFAKDLLVFSEFNRKEKGYLFDAFGISEQPFSQFVFHHSKKLMTVYFSGKSMAQKKDAVVSYTEHKNQNLSASAIDLDLAS